MSSEQKKKYLSHSVATTEQIEDYISVWPLKLSSMQPIESISKSHRVGPRQPFNNPPITLITTSYLTQASYVIINI